MTKSTAKNVSEFYASQHKGIIHNLRLSVENVIKKIGICATNIPNSTVLGLMHDTPLNVFGSDGVMFNPDKIQFIDAQFVPRSRVQL